MRCRFNGDACVRLPTSGGESRSALMLAQFQRLLRDHGITCSEGRAGNVWDNSALESFISSTKIERTARKYTRTRNTARAAACDSIERF